MGIVTLQLCRWRFSLKELCSRLKFYSIEFY